MTNRTVLALAAASALSLGGLSLGGCKREPKSARVDAAIAPLLPPDTAVLAGIRLDKLQNTPFFERYVNGEQELRFFREFQQKTGLDPRKDLWELAVAISPTSRVVFARGKFGGQFGLEPKIDLPGMTRTSYKSYSILATKDGGVLFLNTGLAVLGPVEDLKRVVDGRERSVQAPAALALVERIPAKAHFWAVSSNLGAMMPQGKAEGMAGNFLRMGQTAGEFTAWADLAEGVDLESSLTYPDEAMAAQVRDALKALLGILRLRTPSDQTELLQVYTNVFPSSEGRTVKVKAKTPFALIDQVVRRLPSRPQADRDSSTDQSRVR